MDAQILRSLEDSPVQLCSYSEVMSSSTRTAKAQEIRDNTGNVLNRDATQTQTAVPDSSSTQIDPISNSESCSSHALSAEAATAARSQKRRRSDSSGSLHSPEAVKRKRYSEDTGSTCASSQHRNRENALAAEAVSGFPQISPPCNEATSTSCHEEPGLPQTKVRVPSVRPSLPLPSVHPSPSKSLHETVPHGTSGLTVKEVNVPPRGQMPESWTLSLFAPRPSSTTNARDRQEISLSPIGDLFKNLDEAGIYSASRPHPTHQPIVQEPMFPGIFETRRWGFAKGGGERTAVLVAGDWHPGPDLKPFDPVCYEDNALE